MVFCPYLWKFFITLLLELVYPTTATEVPATPEIKRMPKLVWLDTGLVNYVGTGTEKRFWEQKI